MTSAITRANYYQQQQQQRHHSYNNHHNESSHRNKHTRMRKSSSQLAKKAFMEPQNDKQPANSIDVMATNTTTLTTTMSTTTATCPANIDETTHTDVSDPHWDGYTV